MVTDIDTESKKKINMYPLVSVYHGQNGDRMGESHLTFDASVGGTASAWKGLPGMGAPS